MRILIVYGSKHGFNEECAQRLEKSFTGEEVRCINLKKEKVDTIQKYDLVLVGGSIYAGMIQKEVKTFCQTHLSTLLKKKVGVFVSCGMVDEHKKALGENLPNELIKHAKAIGCFGGELRLERMAWFEKLIVKMVARSQDAPQMEQGFLLERFDEFVREVKRTKAI